MPTAKKQIGCALIGYGGAFNMGRLHGTQINDVPGMKITAVCDADAKRLPIAAQDFPGIETYTDVKELLKSPNVDLCVIILPHNMHAPVALQCLRSGKHVVLEKPMCITTAEAKSMIDAATKAGVTLTVFHNRRLDGDFKTLKHAIEKGLLGQVFSIEMWGGGFGGPRGWWRDKKEISGGAFYDWGAHYLDWLLQIMGPDIQSVTGVTQKLVWKTMTNEDHVQAFIRFASGAVANVQFSSIAHHSLPRWRVLGTKGAAVSGDTGFDYYTEVDGVKVKGLLKYEDSNWEDYYPALGAHLLRGAELPVKPEEAARVIAIMETAEKSAASGKAEQLPKWLQ
ncbi:MAG TPA: Gfo/Idh/MocA family oxidoreductase [Armatimonadota bacterium]|jgi:predicted dehydrogenase